MKNISLFGCGGTTKALAKTFDSSTCIVTFFDDNCVKPFHDSDGFSVKPSSAFEYRYSHLEIPSPAIAPSNPLIKKSENLISEYDYFAHSMPPSVWISGTNGKTTTTQMMQYLLEDRGSVAGGNIGIPLANLDKKASLWILESSSFTLHYTDIASPSIYVLLPISPDHLSWHGSMKEYEDAKLKPLKSMKEGEVAIVPSKYRDIKTDAYLICYDNEKDLASQFGIELEKVSFKGAFLVDAILAMAVDKILFDRVDYKKINSFIVEPHRQEELKDSKNRDWVNDTKATNINATIACLKRYSNRNIHLIVGGDDKGVDLEELFIFMKNMSIKIYAIGSNREKLIKLAEKFNIEAIKCLNLINAIENIDNLLHVEDIAILSPSASSLDEFSSYAQRGEIFKENVFLI